MARSTNNREVIEALQRALKSFLDDHCHYADTDPEWIAETNEMSADGRLKNQVADVLIA
ncbi:MAG TPA: hypothetical protein VF018_04420 [Acidobacteriaceae bacterium]